MAELEKLDDLELENIDGGWITYNPVEEAWQAICDEDYSVLGSFPGEYTNSAARRAAKQCAARSGSEPCEISYGTVVKQRNKQ